MRPGPTSDQLSSAASWGSRVSSWLGSTLLAGDIPILGGRVVATGTAKVPERVNFSVPATTVEAGRTVDWLPRDVGAPLARFGQVVDITIVAEGMDSRIGRFLINKWTEQEDGSIQVEALGMLQQSDDDRLLKATGPRDDGTLASEFLRMVPPYMAAQFDPALVNRAVPRAMEWKENRLDNLYQIADAWPARIRTDPWGQIQVLAPLPEVPDPILVIRDGDAETIMTYFDADDYFPANDIFPGTLVPGGPGSDELPEDDVFPDEFPANSPTPIGDRLPGSRKSITARRGGGGALISAPTADTREATYNMFVARSSANGVEAQAVAVVQGGPMDPTGPYRPVPKFFASPLLLNDAQCLSAATKMRDDSVRTSRIRRVTMVPDPRIELDDAVEIITGFGTERENSQRGYVTGYDLPLTVNDGPLRLDVAVF